MHQVQEMPRKMLQERDEAKERWSDEGRFGSPPFVAPSLRRFVA
jgi:hypothetical protein